WLMVTDSLPPKVSPTSLPLAIAPPPADRARCTLLMVTGPSPNSFESCSRTSLPPSDTYANCRKALLARLIGGLMLVSVSCGAPPLTTRQVCVSLPSGPTGFSSPAPGMPPLAAIVPRASRDAGFGGVPPAPLGAGFGGVPPASGALGVHTHSES